MKAEEALELTYLQAERALTRRGVFDAIRKRASAGLSFVEWTEVLAGTERRYLRSLGYKTTPDSGTSSETISW